MNEEGGVLYDIGANVGAYTLVAASLGLEVVAFEPAPQNFAALHENLERNKLDSLVVTLPFVLGDGAGKIEEFVMHEYARGATEGFFKGQQEMQGARKRFPYVSLDECVRIFGLPHPTGIKLDVDGGERSVLEGSKGILRSPKLRSLLVETDGSHRSYVINRLKTEGFELTSSHPRSGGAENLIFWRKKQPREG
jgi:FkbM family methyltransferase